MSDTWRYCCPECGSHWYEHRVQTEPEYVCRGCDAEFAKLKDKKVAA